MHVCNAGLSSVSDLFEAQINASVSNFEMLSKLWYWKTVQARLDLPRIELQMSRTDFCFGGRVSREEAV